MAIVSAVTMDLPNQHPAVVLRETESPRRQLTFSVGPPGRHRPLLRPPADAHPPSPDPRADGRGAGRVRHRRGGRPPGGPCRRHLLRRARPAGTQRAVRSTPAGPPTRSPWPCASRCPSRSSSTRGSSSPPGTWSHPPPPPEGAPDPVRTRCGPGADPVRTRWGGRCGSGWGGRWTWYPRPMAAHAMAEPEASDLDARRSRTAPHRRSRWGRSVGRRAGRSGPHGAGTDGPVAAVPGPGPAAGAGVGRAHRRP